jgi:hypothetical protein
MTPAQIAITAAAYFHANLLYDAHGRAYMAGPLHIEAAVLDRLRVAARLQLQAAGGSWAFRPASGWGIGAP